GLSILIAFVAVRLGPLTVPGVAGFITALGLVGPTVAYATARPGIIGKQRDGEHPLWSQLLHASYLALCRTTSIVSRLRGDDPWNRVAPGVLLGARPMVREASVLLDEEHVGAVLDLTCELVVPARLRKRARYLCLPTLDGTPPSQVNLDAGVDFVDAERGKHTVYVHCAVGRGRSATLLSAWMLHAGLADDVETAEALLRQERPSVRLHPTQREAVRAWWSQRSA
ncbi:MAG TPA: hypothetical protein DFR83_04450, partial [Deltaproteobacteria bacterium]|nr:hypothetical protein [Deltaproteobacteria bacterium]